MNCLIIIAIIYYIASTAYIFIDVCKQTYFSSDIMYLIKTILITFILVLFTGWIAVPYRIYKKTKDKNWRL